MALSKQQKPMPSEGQATLVQQQNKQTQTTTKGGINAKHKMNVMTQRIVGTYIVLMGVLGTCIHLSCPMLADFVCVYFIILFAVHGHIYV